MIPSTPTTSELGRAAALAALFVTPGLLGTAHAQAVPEPASKKSGQAEEAQPADSAVKLSDVVVVGQAAKEISSPKYTAPLLNTPQTIVVIPSEIYSQQGAATLSDVLRNTPGITFAAGEGGNANATAGDSFYMRGYDATNNIFVDGVRDVGAYSRDVYNTESVEIAKGPSGSDIGRGGASGYVNLVTKRPQLTNFVTGTIAYGFDDETSGTRKRASIDVNQALPDSPIKGTAFRLNAVKQDNDTVGRKTSKAENWGIAPSLAFGLGTATRAYVSYQHNVSDGIPDYGLPVPAFPGYASTPMPPAIDHTTFYGFTADYDKSINDAALIRFERDLGADISVSNQTRYSDVARNAVVTGPATSPTSYVAATGLLTRSRQGNKRDTDILSNLTNIIAHLSTGKIEHDLSAGLELVRENAYQPAFTSATLVAIPVQSPDPSAVPSGAPVRSGAHTKARLDTAALYVFDTVKFTDQWQFNGGLRIDHYDIDYLSVAVGVVPTVARAKDEVLSYKGGLVFKPAANGSVYYSYGLAYRPPGTDFALSTAAGNQNNPETDPQKTTNLELGTKWDFLKGRLSATGSLFKTENSNTVFTDPVLGAIPAGRQTVQGIELGLTGKITADWLVFAGFSYLDSKYNTGTAAQTGATLPLTPKYSGNLWTTYRLPLGITVGGGVQYMGEANRLDTSTTVPRTMPSYWIVNAVASYEINPRCTLRLNVTNLLDEEYVRSFNNNGGRFSFGAPRAYLLSADLKF